jgi:hypothetical protein
MSRARGEWGGWAIELNADILPRLLVNRTYYATVTRKTRDATEKTFLTDCLATANWLAKSLDQRAQTILKVAAEIVKQQDGFLLHGIAHLRPMTLKMVADAIEMHESTVSRVTSNKYLRPPGLFEMKVLSPPRSPPPARSIRRGGPPSHPPADRRRKACRHPFGRYHRRDAAQGAGDRSGAPHRRQYREGMNIPLRSSAAARSARRWRAFGRTSEREFIASDRF